MTAFETTGVLEGVRQLRLDESVPPGLPDHVRVIVLAPEPDETAEQEWLRAAATSPALDLLKDQTEDIYTATDGKPFHDER